MAKNYYIYYFWLCISSKSEGVAGDKISRFHCKLFFFFIIGVTKQHLPNQTATKVSFACNNMLDTEEKEATLILCQTRKQNNYTLLKIKEMLLIQ